MHETIEKAVNAGAQGLKVKIKIKPISDRDDDKESRKVERKETKRHEKSERRLSSRR